MKHEQKIAVQWRDIDYNQHVRHSAYFDYAAQTRIRFFQKVGFDMTRLGQAKVGPIIFHEECTFLREIKLEDTITIVLKQGNIPENGDRWTLHHELINQHGKTVAHISVKGAWMHLDERKLTKPPQALISALRALPQGEAFVYEKVS